MSALGEVVGLSPLNTFLKGKAVLVGIRGRSLGLLLAWGLCCRAGLLAVHMVCPKDSLFSCVSAGSSCPIHPSSPLTICSCQFRVLYSRKRQSCKKQCEDGRLVMCSLPLWDARSVNTFNCDEPKALTTSLVYGRSKLFVFILFCLPPK